MISNSMPRAEFVLDDSPGQNASAWAALYEATHWLQGHFNWTEGDLCKAFLLAQMPEGLTPIPRTLPVILGPSKGRGNPKRP